MPLLSPPHTPSLPLPPRKAFTQLRTMLCRDLQSPRDLSYLRGPQKVPKPLSSLLRPQFPRFPAEFPGARFQPAIPGSGSRAPPHTPQRAYRFHPPALHGLGLPRFRTETFLYSCVPRRSRVSPPWRPSLRPREPRPGRSLQCVDQGPPTRHGAPGNPGSHRGPLPVPTELRLPRPLPFCAPPGLAFHSLTPTRHLHPHLHLHSNSHPPATASHRSPSAMGTRPPPKPPLPPAPGRAGSPALVAASPESGGVTRGRTARPGDARPPCLWFLGATGQDAGADSRPGGTLPQPEVRTGGRRRCGWDAGGALGTQPRGL